MADTIFHLALLAAGWTLGAAWWHHRTQDAIVAAWDAIADAWDDLGAERRDLEHRYAGHRLSDSLAAEGNGTR